jgi:hypothetical protein
MQGKEQQRDDEEIADSGQVDGKAMSVDVHHVAQRHHRAVEAPVIEHEQGFLDAKEKEEKGDEEPNNDVEIFFHIAVSLK